MNPTIIGAKKLTAKKAFELLDAGNTLTQPGKELATFSKRGENYHWCGLSDKGPTIFTPEEARNIIPGIIKNHLWIINL